MQVQEAHFHPLAGMYFKKKKNNKKFYGASFCDKSQRPSKGGFEICLLCSYTSFVLTPPAFHTEGLCLGSFC